MIGVCLGLAGAIWAQLPDGELMLTWQHTVEKIRWAERYRVVGSQLRLEEARIAGNGAGMQIPDSARLHGGQWRYSLDMALDVLRLARTPQAGDYQICLAGGCRSMAYWIGEPRENTPLVELWVCNLD